MKKILFVGSFILIQVVAFGQKKWAVGLSGSLDVTGHYINQANSPFKPAAGYSILANVNYFLNPNLFLKSGIGFYAAGWSMKSDLSNS